MQYRLTKNARRFDPEKIPPFFSPPRSVYSAHFGCLHTFDSFYIELGRCFELEIQHATVQRPLTVRYMSVTSTNCPLTVRYMSVICPLYVRYLSVICPLYVRYPSVICP